MVQLSHPYMTTGRTIALTRWTFVGKVTSLLFNMLSKLVIAFFPRSKHLLISWLQWPSVVVSHHFHCFPICLPWVMQQDTLILVFWMLTFKPTFSLSSFTFIKRLFSSFSLSAIKSGVICVSEAIDTSPGNLDSSLCLIQPNILHDVLWIEVK